jgi:hypothetical protein
MKYILSFVFTVSSLFANEYYAKLEPINTYNIKSSVSGKVIFVNENLKSKIVNNNTVIRIDSKLNKIELQQTKIKRDALKKILKIQKNTLASFNKVSSKSKLEKDAQQITILNTSANISDLNIKIASLEGMILNKTLKIQNNYLSDISVQKGDYVNPGTLLYKSADLSMGKLEIFVALDDTTKLQSKTIFINDVKTDLKINKIYKTTDEKHISSYKVEILVPKPKSFSKLLKITFR